MACGMLELSPFFTQKSPNSGSAQVCQSPGKVLEFDFESLKNQYYPGKWKMPNFQKNVLEFMKISLKKQIIMKSSNENQKKLT